MKFLVVFFFCVSCSAPKDQYSVNNLNPIIGGEAAASEQYPFYVQILLQQKKSKVHLCGATLLNPNWVITAAHCVYQISKEKLILNRQSQTLFGEGGESLIIQEIHLHPEFDRALLKNDIALIRLEKPSQLSFKVNIQLETRFNSQLKLIGWGYTNFPAEAPATLQLLNNIQVAPIDECQFHPEWQKTHSIQVGMLCIFTQMDQKANCIGDSGGPLFFVDSSNEVHLIGITSWGSACRRMQKWNYAGFSDVSYYLNWILRTIKPLCEPEE